MTTFERLYHVPRSQVWEGSGGRQTGNVHLHVADDTFTIGRIKRVKHQALCGKRGWYERPLDPGEEKPLCSRCVEIAGRAAPVCAHCGESVWWSFPRPDDPCFNCGKPVGDSR
jgi:hypothetical protein